MTSNYGWLITHDSIAEPDEPAGTYQNAKGLTGPFNIGADHTATLETVAKAGFTNYHGESVHKFKIYDDDGNLYYTGLYIGSDGAELGEEAFGPLDDFGGPNAGATEIRYLNPTTGEYETL